MTTMRICRVMVCLAAAAIPLGAAEVIPLKPVSAFASVTDPKARSVALFAEAAKVITSPRCMNCHPATRQATQGDDLHPHVPLMYGGRYGVGLPGLPCRACHGPSNVTTLAESIASIPGNPAWGLAPASMAWQGKSLPKTCLQIQDPGRNGGRARAKLREHMVKGLAIPCALRAGDRTTRAPGAPAPLAALTY